MTEDGVQRSKKKNDKRVVGVYESKSKSVATFGVYFVNISGKVKKGDMLVTAKNGKAKKAFEQLVSRYPEYEKIDRAYYYLYLIYSEEGDMARASHYKEILLTEYPGSQYSYAINHPYQPSEGDGRPETTMAEQLYVSTYDMFIDGYYHEVISCRKEAFDTYKENPLQPKFDFLEALSYGHLDSIPVLKNKLGTIIAKYPNHEIEKKAREYLSIMALSENEEGVEDTVVVATETDTSTFVSIYIDEPSNSIFGMVTLDDKTLDIRQTIQLIDMYNDNNFASLKLRVSNAYLNKNTPLILVKRFREKSDAVNYINQLNTSLTELFGENESSGMNLLLITQDNFRTLFTTKKLEDLILF